MIVTPDTIFFLGKMFSMSEEAKLKCIVYTLDDLSEEEIRESITEVYKETAMITVKFQPMYIELEEDEKMFMIVGLVSILIKEGLMPEEYDMREYIEEGKEIIEDFNCFLYPEEADQFKSIKMRKYKASTIYKDYFTPKETVPARTRQPYSEPQKTTLN